MFGCNPNNIPCNKPTIDSGFSSLFFQLLFKIILNNCLMNKCLIINKVKAGTYISIVYIIASLLCPFLGRLIDKIGKRGILISVSMLILIGTMILLKLLPWNIP